MNIPIDRRSVIRAGALGAAGLGLARYFPAWAQTGTPGLGPDMPTLSGEEIALTIAHRPFTVGGHTRHAIMLNGTLPAPLIRLREGQNVRIAVTNRLEEDSSIHWHGIILPFRMDGVPGISFPGIRPGETFVYEFPIRQSGTYWYHSHSGLQEQEGHYGPLIFDPAEPDPVAYDREHVVVLSDWSRMHAHLVFRRLKQEGGFFNRQRMTLAGRLGGDPEHQMPQSERMMWAQMRMDPTDILDVTGSIYTYLINGHGPQENWTGLFRPGERVRLRFINSAAQSIFNVRIPGLRMTVVAADGQNVRPVGVDEFRISVAETYDVIVEPVESRAYTIVSEAIDRSGMGVATLAPRLGMRAEVPPLRDRPLLTMRDMGMGDMAHGGMDMGNSPASPAAPSNHGSMPGMDSGVAGEAMGGMQHGGGPAPGAQTMYSRANPPPGVEAGVGVDNIAAMPTDRTGEPGNGLENAGHRVLTYRDLVALTPNADARPATRTVEVHLTGNMERFMWSFDGVKFSDNPEPIRFARNERVRLRLINDSMMAHPIHIHGHFMELVNGNPGRHPLKHTVDVLPGGTVDLDLTADAPGDWAFHCHLLYHMHAGMMRVVTVRPLDGEGA
ncbi:MAG: copper resistance system multicopper oxidase [Sphingosinicella sp.]|uniref:copper resistance system multicopper oxidase n=1 Tax=Sphingosinicella sp. TaxID=1917971 RepID=UPI0040376537